MSAYTNRGKTISGKRKRGRISTMIERDCLTFRRPVSKNHCTTAEHGLQEKRLIMFRNIIFLPNSTVQDVKRGSFLSYIAAGYLITVFHIVKIVFRIT
jgi:hypothetical protein